MPASIPALLAPAGSPGALQAAVSHGADAVYLGLRHLSARAHATNFAVEQLGPAVELAHSAGCEVLVTLNTLLRDDERPLAARLLRACGSAGVDAVVLQDLGLIALARAEAPALRLHGSTQLAVHDADGAATAAALGLSRVVLARELSIREIASIHQRVPEVELEVFAHGSLCYAYSGLCLASAMAGERRRGRASRGHSHGGTTVQASLALASERCFSGNRGRCTQPCRRPFHAGEQELGLPFSLRDLLSLDLIPALAEAGVAALKIEGRLRSPAYVAAVCHAYRGAIDLAAGRQPPPGWERDEAERAVRSLFSRRASSGYLLGSGGARRSGAHAPVKVQPRMQGHLGVRVGTAVSVEPDAILATVTRPFAVGDRLLATDADGGLRHLELRWLSDGERRSIERAVPGETVRIPPPARYRVAEGSELRLAHAPEVGARFTVEAPRLLPEGWQGPAVALEVETTAGELAVRASAAGVEVTDRFQLGPEPVDALRSPVIADVLTAPGDAFTLGPARCVVREREPLRTPRKALVRVRRDIMRRLELALELRALTECYPAPPVVTSPAAAEASAEPVAESWCLRSDQPGLLALGHEAGFDRLEILLDPADAARLDAALEAVEPGALGCVLPPVLRGREREAVAAQLTRAREAGVRRWVMANVGQERLVARQPGERLEGDDLLYAANPSAVGALRAALGLDAVTLPLELDRARAEAALAAEPAQVVLWADVAVFRAALPPRLPGGLGDEPLVDELEHRYHRAHQGRTSVLVDGVPLCLSGELEALRRIGARRFRVDLCWRPYTPDEARTLLAELLAGRSIPGTSTGGWGRRWL